MTMTDNNDQLPRAAAELEALASYYDTHDTSKDMKDGQWVDPQSMTTTSQTASPGTPAGASTKKTCAPPSSALSGSPPWTSGRPLAQHRLGSPLTRTREKLAADAASEEGNHEPRADTRRNPGTEP
jgi:hypothetical protein